MTVLEEVAAAQNQLEGNAEKIDAFPIEWVSVIAEAFGYVAKYSNNMRWPGYDTMVETIAARQSYRNNLVKVAATIIMAVESFDREQEKHGLR